MAIDPEALRSYIARRGSRLFHVTPVENVPQIRDRGLVPGSERGVSTRGDFFSPRPGHVYMVKLNDVAVIEVNGEPRVLSIDLEQLDPALIDPDEDMVQQHFASMMDIEPPSREMTDGQESPGQVGRLANWADTTRGFDRPEVTVRSLEEHGRVSHRGAIPADAVELVELPSEHLVDFTRRLQDVFVGEQPPVAFAGMWRTEVERAKALGTTVVAAATQRLGVRDLVVDLSNYVPAQDVEHALRRLALEAVRDDPPRLDHAAVARAAASTAAAAAEFEPISVRDNLDCALAVAEHAAATVAGLARVSGVEAADAVARQGMAAASAVSWNAHLIS
jgi:hypothetical protein